MSTKELANKLFLSTPSARRATAANKWLTSGQPISIHALREEGDHTYMFTRQVVLLFLSTPSARRATDSQVLQ